jgi:hypothetical protein
MKKLILFLSFLYWACSDSSPALPSTRIASTGGQSAIGGQAATAGQSDSIGGSDGGVSMLDGTGGLLLSAGSGGADDSLAPTAGQIGNGGAAGSIADNGGSDAGADVGGASAGMGGSDALTDCGTTFAFTAQQWFTNTTNGVSDVILNCEDDNCSYIPAQPVSWSCTDKTGTTLGCRVELRSIHGNATLRDGIFTLNITEGYFAEPYDESSTCDSSIDVSFPPKVTMFEALEEFATGCPVYSLVSNGAIVYAHVSTKRGAVVKLDVPLPTCTRRLPNLLTVPMTLEVL